MFDAQDSLHRDDEDEDKSEKSDMDDDDKILHNKIGFTEVAIDKVLSNLLVMEEFYTIRNVILKPGEDAFSDAETDVFSNHSSNKQV